MCQQQIIKYLIKQSGKPVDIISLCRSIPSNRQSISRACRTLVRFKEIEVKKVKEKNFEKNVFYIKKV